MRCQLCMLLITSAFILDATSLEIPKKLPGGTEHVKMIPSSVQRNFLFSSSARLDETSIPERQTTTQNPAVIKIKRSITSSDTSSDHSPDEYLDLENITQRTRFSPDVPIQNFRNVQKNITKLLQSNGTDYPLTNLTELALDGRAADSKRLLFLDVPKGDDLKINQLDFDESYLPLEGFSLIMGYLQSMNFPTELLRDALSHRLSFHLLAFQVMKSEIFVASWLLLWAVLAICLPIGVVVALCCGHTNARRLNEDFPGESEGERTLGWLLHILLLLLLCSGILILAANEQMSRAILRAPDTVNTIYEDVYTFIRNTHMQISFVATSSMDIAIEAIRRDLEEVDVLLGKPYQLDLSTETGIDVALIELEELKSALAKISILASDILENCAVAERSGKNLQERLSDVSHQLTVIRQQCVLKDRALCYTLQFSGFDVAMPLHNLTNDAKLRHLMHLNKDTSFNTSIATARKTFADIPEKTILATAPFVSELRNLLSQKRTELYKASYVLDVTMRSLSEEIRTTQDTTETTVKIVAQWETWRWLTFLGIAAFVFLVWALLLCGAPCGCGTNSKTVRLLLAGLGLASAICLLVWFMSAATFLVGGHGEALLCQPLHDQPHYRVLSELVDSGGVLYEDGGLFKTIAKDFNDTLKVADILRNLQAGQTAYYTFHVYNQINVENLISYKNWQDIKSLFNNFSTTGGSSLDILSPSLQINLQALSTVSSVNLTAYRVQMSSPITRRHLSSFADQLNTVARQLTDPVTARKLDNLAFAIRKVVHDELQALNEVKNKLLYKITTLEVLLPPLNKQVNDSLGHLKNVQFYLNTQAWQIFQRARRHFLARLEAYLGELTEHVQKKATREIGKCRPLWKIFHAARFSLCRLVVDPLNAIAFASFLLILIFLTLSPVVVKLVNYYRDREDDLLTTISHRRSRDGMLIDSECTWATPSSESPPRVDVSRIPEPPPHTSWTTPHEPPRVPNTVSSRINQARLPQVPSISVSNPPKSKLSSIASRLTGGRNLTCKIPTVSRARTPRRGHESLKLIEPLQWKSGSTTPRSWI